MKINIFKILLILAFISVVISLKQNHLARKRPNSPKHKKPATKIPKPVKCPPQVVLYLIIEYTKC